VEPWRLGIEMARWDESTLTHGDGLRK